MSPLASIATAGDDLTAERADVHAEFIQWLIGVRIDKGAAVGIVHVGKDAVIVALRIVVLQARPRATTNLPSWLALMDGSYCQVFVVLLTRNSLLCLANSRGVVTPGIDAVAAAVLAEALPGDHEVAGGIHGDLRIGLLVGGVGVESGTRRPGVGRRR